MALDVVSNGMMKSCRSASSTENDVRAVRGYCRQSVAAAMVPSSSGDSVGTCGRVAAAAAAAAGGGAGSVIATEVCQVGNEVCELPSELFGLSDLGSVLSLETWNSCLTDEDRCSLLRFLPPVGPEGIHDTLHDLLGGADFHFGSPLAELWKRLQGGHCNPRVVRYNEGLVYLQRKQHYHHLREYHNKMVNNLLEMRKLWELYPEADLSDKVNRWKEYKTQQYGKVVPAPINGTPLSPPFASKVPSAGKVPSSNSRSRQGSHQQQQQRVGGEENHVKGAVAAPLKTPVPSSSLKVRSGSAGTPPLPPQSPRAAALSSFGVAFASLATQQRSVPAVAPRTADSSPIITKIPKVSASSRKRNDQEQEAQGAAGAPTAALKQPNNHKRPRMSPSAAGMASRGATPPPAVSGSPKLLSNQHHYQNGGTASMGKKSPVLAMNAATPIPPPPEANLQAAEAVEPARELGDGGPPFSTRHVLGAVRAALLQPLLSNNGSVPGEIYWWSLRDIVEMVRVNPGDQRLANVSAEAVGKIVRAALYSLAHRPTTASAGLKQSQPLVHHDKENKLWAWTGPTPPSLGTTTITMSDGSPVLVIQADTEGWGVSRKVIAKVDNYFRDWLVSLKLDELFPPPLPPPVVPATVSDKERFSSVRAQKSTVTIDSSTMDMRQYFRMEERHRYAVPDRAFHYTARDGGKAVVAPIRRGGGKPTSKARDHFMLKPDRPPHVTILCLVRDAAARLPDGIGTRADVCELLRDSQYIVEDVSDSQINQVVSGALDRLHYERDPCVKYCGDRKLWMYLHRNRMEEDFEVDGTTSTKRWRRPRKDARGVRLAENDAQTPSPRVRSPSADEASGSPASNMQLALVPAGGEGMVAAGGSPQDDRLLLLGNEDDGSLEPDGNGGEATAAAGGADGGGYYSNSGRRSGAAAAAELGYQEAPRAPLRLKSVKAESGLQSTSLSRRGGGTVPGVTNLNRCPPRSGSSSDDGDHRRDHHDGAGTNHLTMETVPMYKGHRMHGGESNNSQRWQHQSSGYGGNWAASGGPDSAVYPDEGTEEEEEDARHHHDRRHLHEEDHEEMLDQDTE
ncbi:hypothetical protein CBR_g17672 [Chara braunii]|uniref:DEUBAD domain-containing protein n=1 Tax=Chara braunii TaxID=69332 RepID=A0A388KV64_CHABU|nr:hypothetical protein CBR_g17672 [Chara braunii]|eukprot:GBG73960.1 hypothetical protein CBR_g17672 [Chara braunii]